jgi:poly(glycerol-phosphate) alpha-glucosyltransferase
MGDSKWSGLQQLLDMSDSDRIEMGRRGRRLVEEKFTWPKVASQMKQLYEEILGG